jgi:molecular chaperone HscB
MTSDTRPRTIQVCRECGGGAPVDVHFCPQCTKILSLGRQGDYFAFMGVQRRLNLDLAELEQRFRALSRQFHPDYFYNATPAERRASLERASYLNDAYRTLKQPISRIGYLLELEGVWTGADRGGTPQSGANAVPAALLEEVFALNEELDEVREMREGGAPESEWTARLQRARVPIEDKRVEHERQLNELAGRWDALLDGDGSGSREPERREVLSALRERMLERNYISNLLATIDREMSGSGPEPKATAES